MKILLVLLLPITAMASKLTLQVKKPNHTLVLREKKKFVEYHPNASLHWGIKFLTDYFYIEYGQKIPGTNFNNSDVGNNTYKDLHLGIYVSNHFFEVFHKEYIGFSSNEEDKSLNCDLCSNRPDLTSRETNFIYFWALNPDFKMGSLTSSGIGGVDSQSSWVFGLYANRHKFRAPYAIVQNDKASELPYFADTKIIENETYGFNLGYGVNIPLGSLFYVSFYGGAGGGPQRYKITKKDGSHDHGKDLTGHWGLRLNLGTQGEAFTMGLKGLLYSNVYGLGDSKNLASVNYSIYIYTVLKF